MSVKKLSVKKIKAIKGGESLCTYSNVSGSAKGTSNPGTKQECQ